MVLTWVVTAYALLFGGLLLSGGRAADLFGAHWVVLTGLMIFTAESLLAGSASGSRCCSPAGSCRESAPLAVPAALSLVTTTFHGPDKALGVWAALGGTGVAAGILLGGVLTAGPGWRWVFFLNVPVGVAVLLALPAVVPAGRANRQRRRIDAPRR